MSEFSFYLGYGGGGTIDALKYRNMKNIVVSLELGSAVNYVQLF